MAEFKLIHKILPAHPVDMGGFPVLQPIPTQNVEQIDPFLLLHHARIKVPQNRKSNDVGIGPHPHRGFSPVTFIFEGDVHHRDSLGNSSVIKEGGTQWVDAGQGIIHSERPSKALIEKGGYQEIIQLWINVKADKKMNPANYQALDEASTPLTDSSAEGKSVRVVSGEFEGIKGPIQSNSEIMALRLNFKKDQEYQFKIPEGFNSFIYLLDGAVEFNRKFPVEGKNLIWFKNEGDSIHLKAEADFRGILLAGRPLNEPLETYGPFVMNTQSQIMQAMRDYQMGKMGVLIEDFDE
ncbi:MAG: pirin-like C-terminal cupin domain-containing protein [Cytophagales bacterium]